MYFNIILVKKELNCFHVLINFVQLFAFNSSGNYNNAAFIKFLGFIKKWEKIKPLKGFIPI